MRYFVRLYSEPAACLSVRRLVRLYAAHGQRLAVSVCVYDR